MDPSPPHPPAHPSPGTSEPAPAVNWSRVKEIAGEALDLPAADREAFLDLACDGEPELRRRVEAILRADQEADGDGFLRPRTVDVPEPPTGAVGGRPGPDDAGVLLGKRIGRYRVKRLIGAGGMGAVYEAMQDQPRRVVALKVMRAGLTSRSALRRFQYEAQLLARLRHPGIAQVYEAGTHEMVGGAVPFFAMEYIPAAKPITAYAESWSLPTRERLALFVKVCDAVHHGHQKGVVHRDLKPSNILVDSGGAPKIIDFGVARATDSDLAVTTLQTGVGQMIGTLQYMSPEQCMADPADIDIRADVYSLGVVLYELLTGRLPYEIGRAPAHEAARVILEQPPARPSTLNKALRGDVETITLKALEKDRDRRYQSAADLARDIERYLANEPIVARPASLAYQASVFARRHKVIVGATLVSSLAVLVALAAIAAGLAGALRERDRAREAEAAAQRQAARAQRITDFLKATIIAADPYLSDPGTLANSDELLEEVPDHALALPPVAGREFTVVDSLRHAAAMLDSAFPDDPDTAAELAEVIGSTLSQLGLFREAEPLLRRAVESRRTILGETHPDTIRSIRRLAANLQNAGDFAGAEPLYRTAVESTRQLRGPFHPLTLRARRDLAANLAAQDRYEEALTFQRDTLAQAERIYGESDPVTLSQAAALASVVLAAGDAPGAEKLARRAHLGLRSAGQTDSLRAADAALILAKVLQATDQVSEAELLLREALRIYSLRFGARSVRTLAVRSDLASVLTRLGRHAEAVQAARELTEITRRAFGPESHHTGRAEHHLALTLARAGANLEEAEALARHALEVARRVAPEPGSFAATVADTLADILRRAGRTEEARRALDDLAATLDTLPEEARRPYLASVDHHRGLCAWERGDLEQAELLLVNAARCTESLRSPVPSRREELAADLSRFYQSTGRPEEARRWRDRLTRRR